MEKLQKYLKILWALNVFDVIITMIILGMGGWELNPMLWYLGGSIIYTVLYKVSVLLVISFIVIRGYKEGDNFKTNAIGALNGFFILIGIINVYNLFFIYASR